MAIVKRFKYEMNDAGKWVKADPAEVTGYQVVVTRTHPATGKRQRKIVKSFPAGKWKLAQAANKRAEADVLSGEFEWEAKKPEPQTVIPTVKEACEAWIVQKRRETNKQGRKLSANHIRSYEGSLKNHIDPAFGDLLVTELTRKGIQAVVDEWEIEIEDERKAKHPQTVARALVMLAGALDLQVEDDVITANPCTNIRKAGVAKGKKSIKLWDTEEITRFFQAASEHDWHPAFLLGELEGLRRGEILGLRWSDIRGLDTKNGPVIVSIEQTCVADQLNGGRALLQQRAKTESSQREIRLTTPTIEALRKHRDTQRFTKKTAGELWVNNDLVICNEVGEPVRPAWFTIATRRMVEEAGLPPITPHKMRHHAATRMLRTGVPIALVAEKLGHRDVSLTYGTYGNLDESAQEVANAAIERVLATGTSES